MRHFTRMIVWGQKFRPKFLHHLVNSDGQSPGFGSVLSVKRLDFKHFTVLKRSANPVIAQYCIWYFLASDPRTLLPTLETARRRLLTAGLLIASYLSASDAAWKSCSG